MKKSEIFCMARIVPYAYYASFILWFNYFVTAYIEFYFFANNVFNILQGHD